MPPEAALEDVISDGEQCTGECKPAHKPARRATTHAEAEAIMANEIRQNRTDRLERREREIELLTGRVSDMLVGASGQSFAADRMDPDDDEDCTFVNAAALGRWLMAMRTTFLDPLPADRQERIKWMFQIHTLDHFRTPRSAAEHLHNHGIRP